jgi:hypothetical protein
MREVNENWRVGVMERWSDGKTTNTPSLHYSIQPFPAYSANAARQSRISGKPSCSESKQRSGV